MERADGTGLLLLNLGTPASTDRAEVRRYLAQFLSDPRVVDIPGWQRWLVMNLFVLPRRPKRSAEAYSKIWTDRGSPLLFHTQDLAKKVQERLGPEVVVEAAMLCGEPSLQSVLERMTGQGIDRIVVFPLYPQYASATTGSTLQAVFDWAGERWNVPSLQVVPSFFDHPAFIDAFAEVARPVLERLNPELVFFSFHGLPERQIFKGDPTGSHCLKRENCCETPGQGSRNCYRAQCVATGRLLADRLSIPEEKYRLCFQSRLGRAVWIGPATDELLRQEAAAGCRRAAILSPAFVADCLETIEELGIRGVETWRESGGETLELIPCPNSSDSWADAVVTLARESSNWLGSGDRSLESATRTSAGVRSGGGLT